MHVQDTNILAFHPILDHRNVFPRPIFVLRELGTQFLALRITVVAPKVPNLIEVTELARPTPKIDAIVVAADKAADFLRVLELFRQVGRQKRIGPHFVEHDLAPPVNFQVSINRRSALLDRNQ
jgi:hypothetical protein